MTAAFWVALVDFTAIDDVRATDRTDEASGGRGRGQEDDFGRVCRSGKRAQPFSGTGSISIC